MTTKLLIGNRANGRPFYMPPEFTTETAGILARKGAGKTYTAHVIAEELLENDQQIIAIDPLNAWWGLRSKYKIVIFGGDHGDMPLEAHMGHAIADLVTENPGMSCVLSLRHLRKNKMRSFVTDFAETLFHNKGSKASPMHLFVDEADMFAPQRVHTGQERMLGAMEDIVRRGRQSGIGCTMITQRSASLNKDVLTQVEILITGQITGPQDKKAIREWIEQNADIEKQNQFLSSLAQLQVGELWFWSPAFLKVLERIHVRKKRTYDSSATPKAGKRLKKMKARPINLKAIRTKLSGVVEEAQSSEPRILKAEIARLKKELDGKVPAAIEYVKPKIEAVVKEKVAVAKHQAVLDRDIEWVKSIRLFVGRLDRSSVSEVAELVGSNFDSDALIPKLPKNTGRSIGPELPAPRGMVFKTKIPAAAFTRNVFPSPPLGHIDTDLGRCERAILNVLVQQGRPCSKILIALQSGYSSKSGGFNNSLSKLKKAGHIQSSRSKDTFEATAGGASALGPVEPEAVRNLSFWMGHNSVGRCGAKILKMLSEHGTSTKYRIAEVTEYQVSSGGFNNTLSKLRTLGLIEGKSEISLSSELEG